MQAAFLSDRNPLVEMLAVWSFWSKPWLKKFGSGWFSEKHHWCSWILSVETARKHYPQTRLVTDDLGARLLVDGLGLEFEQVSTELNALADCDPAVWSLGKLWAYRAQTKPFVHLDADVYLWKRLPERIESAPVFGQNPELFALGASHYRPEAVQTALTKNTSGWIPVEWEWSLSHGSPQSAACCGIFGGNHLEFVYHYADSAIRCVQDTRNSSGWSSLGGAGNHVTLLEQYHLAACATFHYQRPQSTFRSVELRHLFPSESTAFQPNAAAQMGYTHLLADAKRDKRVAGRLEQRVKRDFPNFYPRCFNINP